MILSICCSYIVIGIIVASVFIRIYKTKDSSQAAVVFILWPLIAFVGIIIVYKFAFTNYYCENINNYWIW